MEPFGAILENIGNRVAGVVFWGEPPLSHKPHLIGLAITRYERRFASVLFLSWTLPGFFKSLRQILAIIKAFRERRVESTTTGDRRRRQRAANQAPAATAGA